MKLTGKIRYRLQPQFFGKTLLVHQVEETRELEYELGGYIETDTYNIWRDATVEDLQVLGQIGVIKNG